MIQRIQSLFLFFASALLSCQFAVPYYIAPSHSELEPKTLILPAAFSDGVLNPLDNFGLLGLTILGSLISLWAIFLFKNRSLQGRLAGMSGVISVLVIALAVFVWYQTTKGLPEHTGSFGFGLALPVAALVLQYLAQRAIKKDEKLVRSMDRLRD